jgi:hypothetical protein
LNALLVYPLPFDDWDTFLPFVRRFTDTFRKHPPGHDYVLYAMCCWGDETDSIREMFYGIKTLFIPYYENGCDIGCAQRASKSIAEANTFALNFTTRCYFHRPGWLKRYMQARKELGPGLYGATTSWEGGHAHVCTRAYGLDSDLFHKYPALIDTRHKGEYFEVGDGSITNWILEEGFPAVQVTWDGVRHLADSRHADETDIFRRGTQSACLVWDKHTDAYANADPKEKQRLARLADGPYNPEGIIRQ